MSAELVAFMRARLAEDEQAAESAPGGPWHVDSFPYVVPQPDLVWAADEIVAEVRDGAAHIARWDPARVLRHVAAVRAVLDGYEVAERHVAETRRTAPEYRWVQQAEGPRDALLFVLRHLSAEHAEHPDYRQEWAP